MLRTVKLLYFPAIHDYHRDVKGELKYTTNRSFTTKSSHHEHLGSQIHQRNLSTGLGKAVIYACGCDMSDRRQRQESATPAIRVLTGQSSKLIRQWSSDDAISRQDILNFLILRK
jgi:hypothetical protein